MLFQLRVQSTALCGLLQGKGDSSSDRPNTSTVSEKLLSSSRSAWTACRVLFSSSPVSEIPWFGFLEDYVESS